MKIIHISDWHGRFPVSQLPEADVYVVTGDMLENNDIFVLQDPKSGRTVETSHLPTVNWLRDVEGFSKIGTLIDPTSEISFQRDWIKSFPFRKNTGLDERARVIVVRGNHDYIDLEPWIGGNCFEVKDSGYETISFDGILFGGIRGVCTINGCYADELDESTFYDRAATIHSDLDVLVTHAPPKGIFAKARDGNDYGSQALRRYVDQRAYANRPLKAHLFGHVHTLGQQKMGETVFSNAATGIQEIEL